MEPVTIISELTKAKSPLILLADLATDRKRQMTTTRANQTTGLTNGRVANWTPEVAFPRVPVPLLSQLIMLSMQPDSDLVQNIFKMCLKCSVLNVL